MMVSPGGRRRTTRRTRTTSSSGWPPSTPTSARSTRATPRSGCPGRTPRRANMFGYWALAPCKPTPSDGGAASSCSGGLRVLQRVLPRPGAGPSASRAGGVPPRSARSARPRPTAAAPPASAASRGSARLRCRSSRAGVPGTPETSHGGGKRAIVHGAPWAPFAPFASPRRLRHDGPLGAGGLVHHPVTDDARHGPPHDLRRPLAARGGDEPEPGPLAARQRAARPREGLLRRQERPRVAPALAVDRDGEGPRPPGEPRLLEGDALHRRPARARRRLRRAAQRRRQRGGDCAPT